MNRKPQILLTNDDGIYSQGIWYLYKVLSSIGKIKVIAPQQEMSGVSHAFTYNKPVLIDKIMLHGVACYPVKGTPADTVKIGVTQIFKKLPDFVISGINAGDNSGVSCHYSGTVAAAREGCFWKIPSLAVSVKRYDMESYKYASLIIKKMIQGINKRKIDFDSSRVFLNINFPDCVPGRIKGIKVTRQGLSPFKDDYEQRTSPMGMPYYWVYGKKEPWFKDEEDDAFISKGFITVTPLNIDNTEVDFYNKYKETEIVKC
ncbi:MAG: 5'/3'-nucleotidase SurE [bacterium]